jgi:hypothetical protein
MGERHYRSAVVEDAVDADQHRGQRHAGLVPGARQGEIARREDVVAAAPRAQVRLDRGSVFLDAQVLHAVL